MARLLRCGSTFACTGLGEQPFMALLESKGPPLAVTSSLGARSQRLSCATRGRSYGHVPNQYGMSSSMSATPPPATGCARARGGFGGRVAAGALAGADAMAGAEAGAGRPTARTGTPPTSLPPKPHDA